MGVIVGVDIGGTNIRIGAVDEEQQLVCSQKLPQETVLCGEEPLHSFVEFVKAYLSEQLGEEEVEALAIGIPAALNRERTAVLNAPNINGFNGVNVWEKLQGQFSFPVFLEKDVTMLFYHDLYAGCVDNDGILIGCYIGTGVGNVISIDGKLLTGKDGAACELGHIPVWDQRDVCACGNEGCMESHVGGKYLVHLQQTCFPDTPIHELFLHHGESPEIEAYVEHLSLPIATEVTLLNPDRVILGGGIISMPGFPREKLEQYLYRHTRKPFPADNLQITYAEDGGQNGILGCALFAREKLAEFGRKLG